MKARMKRVRGYQPTYRQPSRPMQVGNGKVLLWPGPIILIRESDTEGK